MPASDDKKELGGLARSIDSLFASAAETREVESGPSEAEASEGAGTPPAEFDAASETIEATPTEAEGPQEEGVAAPEEVDMDPTVEDVGEVDTAVVVEPLSAEASGAEAEPEMEPASAELEGAFALGPVDDDEPDVLPEAAQDQASVELDDESDVVEAPDDEADVDAPTAVEASEPEPVAEAEDEPTPLDLAVESYLAGGGDEVRLRALAVQELEARHYDGVARAAERLVIGPGETSQSDRVRVASELLNPLVRSRIVQRMGAEKDEERRNEYFEMCKTLGLEMAEAIRDEMAETTDRGARRVCFDALVAMMEVSRPVVEAMAEDENRFLARNGVAILGEVGGGRAAELVAAATWNSDSRVRREAALSLARLNVEDADALVMQLLTDSDDSVRLAAVVAAGELRIERAVRLITSALDDAYETEEVLPLLRALGQIGDPGAVGSIERHAVKDRFGKARTEVRIAAYQALNHIGTPHARRLLNQAISDKDPAVKSVVKQLLHIR